MGSTITISPAKIDVHINGERVFATFDGDMVLLKMDPSVIEDIKAGLSDALTYLEGFIVNGECTPSKE